MSLGRLMYNRCCWLKPAGFLYIGPILYMYVCLYKFMYLYNHIAMLDRVQVHTFIMRGSSLNCVCVCLSLFEDIAWVRYRCVIYYSQKHGFYIYFYKARLV